MEEADNVVRVTDKNKKRIKIIKADNNLKRENEVITMLLDSYSVKELRRCHDDN